MTTRAQLVPGLLAALATIVVSTPLHQLFEDASWALPAAVGVLLVAGVGVLLRAGVGHTGVTILGQALAAGLYVLVTQLPETTVFGVVPTPETVTRLVEHVRDAQETITRFAAPAPETPGITVVLVIIVMIVGLAVDMSAATAGSPAIAGLPLLSLFLVSAANSGGSLPWGWFLLGAALWLAMIAHQSDIDLREWTTSIPLLGQEDGQGGAERSLRWQAARVSAVCLAVAMLLPAVLPHLPTRYVLDGLGRGGVGSAGTTDGIQLSTELDLKRSLESPSQEPVLSYTTDDPTPGPLRVAVVEDFTDGFGRMGSGARAPRSDFSPRDPLAGVPDTIPRERRTFVADANGVAAPQLAVPENLVGADLDGIGWSLGADGTARVQRTPGTYSATFTELEPEEEHFDETTVPEPIDPTADRDAYLALDPGSAEEIRELAARLAPGDGDRLGTAQAIQEYLRGPDFTYSLDLPRPEGGPDDPIVSFLETRTGYCQQFAATMTLLARAQGIPARVVVGFLPGDTLDGDERLVRASDAHAWPELYFEGVGWTRFEPTKGTQSADIPGYSIDTDGGAVPTDDTTSEPETTTTTTTQAAPAEEDMTPDGAQEGWLRRWSGWLLAALLAVAALAILPVTAVLARRREWATAVDDTARVEHEWRDLLDRIEDLGMEPPAGATPRDLGEWLGRRAHLEGETRDRLDHVVGTLERARYGRPGQDLPDVSADVSAVVGEVREQRMRSTRVRAALWPSAGVDAWLGLPRRVTDRLRRR